MDFLENRDLIKQNKCKETEALDPHSHNHNHPYPVSQHQHQRKHHNKSNVPGAGNAVGNLEKSDCLSGGSTATTTSLNEESRNCKVHPLLPPQRLAIPNNNKEKEYNSLENKPLVQWESSDESEEELSFFPAAKSRGVLTDNLSIDSQSIEDEEDDLHLSPPRQLSRKNACCAHCILT